MSDNYLTREQIKEIIDSMSSGNANKNENSELKTGDLVWVKNDKYDENNQDNSTKPFYKAIIQADNGGTYQCKLEPSEECREPKFLQPFAHPKDLILQYSLTSDKGLSDMIEIDELNHATILYNLFVRFKTDDIYSYVGPTLLAVNPFKNLSQKYPPELLARYQDICKAGDDYYEVMRELPPHTYAISAYAHKSMMVSKVRQGIVISGESGAGKTESARQCMAFLTSLGSKDGDDGRPSIGDRILSTNPVLEAFGNAKTARNDNSSRFGKYVKLYFNIADGKVCGAEIKNYLLEKSRVIGCTPVERNYHAFFMMLRGCQGDRAQ